MPTTAPIKVPIVGENKLAKDFQKVTQQARRFGQGLSRIGSTMTSRLTMPLVGAGVAAVKVGSDYDFAMRKVQAKVEITTKSIGDLRTQSKELGRTTVHTAREVAGAQEKMAMAGWKSHEVFNALPAVLDLSTASGTELIQTADIASNIMQTFAINSAEAGRVSDVLSTVVAGANVDMEMLADTMKYAGPSAKMFGASMEDTAAAAGFLGNMGIQGSMAGTAMSNMFINLAAPTGKAADLLRELGTEVSDKTTGKIRNYRDILKDLAVGMTDLGQQKRLAVIKEIFGKRALRAAGPAVADIGKMNSSLESFSRTVNNIKPGKASEMVAIMTGGATGSMKRFTSALEGLGIAFAESGLLDNVSRIAEYLAGFMKGLADLAPETRAFYLRVAGITAIIGPALVIIGKLVAVGATIAGAIGPGGAAIAALTSPVGIAAAAIMGLAGAAWYLRDELEPVIDVVKIELTSAFTDVVGSGGVAKDMLLDLGGAAKQVVSFFAPFASVLTKVHFKILLLPLKAFIKNFKVVARVASLVFRIFSAGAAVVNSLATKVKGFLQPALDKLSYFFDSLKAKIRMVLWPLRKLSETVQGLAIDFDALFSSGDDEKTIKVVGGTNDLGLKNKNGDTENLGMGRGSYTPYEKGGEPLADMKTPEKAKVEVEFKNMPKDTRVAVASGDVSLWGDTGPLMEGI